MSTLSRAPVVHLLMADRSSFLMITCDTAAPESKCSTAFAQRGDLCAFALQRLCWVDCNTKQFGNAAYMRQLQPQD